MRWGANNALGHFADNRRSMIAVLAPRFNQRGHLRSLSTIKMGPSRGTEIRTRRRSPIVQKICIIDIDATPSIARTNARELHLHLPEARKFVFKNIEAGQKTHCESEPEMRSQNRDQIRNVLSKIQNARPVFWAHFSTGFPSEIEFPSDP